jgi:hypothetical protein
MWCFFEVTRARWSPTAGVARPPRVCAFVVATAWQHVRGPDPVFFTLLGGAWCCSGTSAMGPAWRWFSWCGTVCFSTRVSIDAGSRREVSAATFESMFASGRRV